jgi:hypothetical protein
MKQKFFWSFIALFILSWNGYAAPGKPDLPEVDFGSVQASEPVHRIIRSCSVPVKIAKPAGVAVAFPGLVNYQNNGRIPLERLSLIINSKVTIMTASLLSINFNEEISKQQIGIKFGLDLEPIDLPGIYQGVIQFRFWGVNQDRIQWSEPIRLTLTVRVASWVRLKTDDTYIKFQPDMVRNRKNLKIREPLRIQIAANTDWRLSISIASANAQLNGNMPLFFKADDHCKQYQGSGQISITARDGKKGIASGPATVSGKNYWCEVPVDVYLGDYPDYPAGFYYFTVNFFSELFES